eukprot:gnl/TRDRNA2_/TRDRNA2_196863_c0_seq1.p1 gnl/TRDRNA2_/TRDRNA2_196863_c0~~gnl/TRDRNA2_/TRDRNA2_196863_c0_seq1.p1  ORF type:complete len:386 (-),score=43.77 gnl/TRDRNA2_/TRDRNA2_196863_c0_seq1:160-1317(-)
MAPWPSQHVRRFLIGLVMAGSRILVLAGAVHVSDGWAADDSQQSVDDFLEEEDALWRNIVLDICRGVWYKQWEYPVTLPATSACAAGDLQQVGGRDFRHLRSQRANGPDLDEAGYQMCPQESLHRPGCVVYTCGVDEDPSFEVDLSMQYPNCDIFAFDPSASARRWVGYLVATLDPPLPPNFRYLPWAWGSRDALLEVPPRDVSSENGTCYDSGCSWPWDVDEWGQSSFTWHSLQLSSIARRLNHTRVDLVKMDCEGIEYLPGVLEAILALEPEQIVFEQHSFKPVVGEAWRTTDVSALEWRDMPMKLYEAGYLPIWIGREEQGLGEYTWARRELTGSRRTPPEVSELLREYRHKFMMITQHAHRYLQASSEVFEDEMALLSSCY